MTAAAADSKPHVQLAALAATAFLRDPFYAWLAPTLPHRRRLLAAIMRRVLATTARAMAPDGDALVAYRAPWHRPAGGGLSLGLLAFLRRPIRAYRAWHFLRQMQRHLPRTPHVHIEVIVVAESARGRGLARALLAPILARARAHGLVVHLETTNPDNLAFYARLGFNEVARIEVAGVPAPAWVLQLHPPSASAHDDDAIG